MYSEITKVKKLTIAQYDNDVQPVPKSVGPTYDPTASAESSVSLSFLSSHHDIFSMNSYVMNSYFNANI